jgi:hypothetical protein
MTLNDPGHNDPLEEFRIEQKPEYFDIERVVAEHKERYIVKALYFCGIFNNSTYGKGNGSSGKNKLES